MMRASHNTGHTEIVFLVFGANLNFNDEGAFMNVMDADFIAKLAHSLASAQGEIGGERGRSQWASPRGG